MFKKIKRIHFIGIGGSGMSGIAEVLLKLGYYVSGSDASRNAVTLRLESLGAHIALGHAAQHVTGADVVVTSTAISKTNPEVKAALKSNIPVIPRIEMLAEIARLKYTIAVGGTHGKTTTTSLVGQILKVAGLDPTVIVGGRLKAVGTGGVLGNGDFLVAEADESDGSFLKLTPTLAIVTNIDNDHLDYYKNMENLEEAFATFANHIPFYGATYLCGEDAGVKRIVPKLNRRCLFYGFKSSFDLWAANIELNERGSRFTVVQKGKTLGSVELPLSGKHNILNALAAIAVALHIDIPFHVIAEALYQFEGVGRRIEIKGETQGVMVVDDYGHHPTEIKATLGAIKSRWPNRRLVALFQPHRYTRTQILAKQFAAALQGADYLFLMPIYAAGEKPIKGISTQSIAHHLNKKNFGLWSWDKPISELSSQLKSGDIFLTLGAGDVWKVGEEFLKENESLFNQLSKAFPQFGSRLKAEEPLNRHSTWGIGGPAECFIETHTFLELQSLYKWCKEKHHPFFILGWGSNVLLPDQGLRGVVARLRGEFENIEFNGNNVHVGAGVHLPKLAKACVQKGLEGVEALAGVPGTVGGALMTNAGTPRGVIGDVLSSVHILTPEGEITTLRRHQIDLKYRSSSLMGHWVISAELSLRPSTNGQAAQRLKEELALREKTQPLGTKNVGSVFRNPNGDFAARLIEASGLKGKTFGKMRFSPKHANFIENTGGATAKNALELILLAQTTVKEKFNIDLHPEVIVVTQPKPL
ncbi:MAG: UDP-N-acetylmuramate--L-alanine ligase [Elusimicrobia bacterium]|nr:UDP-N-acetylmuramate--L-alanine ligase [Elusimicrobiota bacterium]